MGSKKILITGSQGFIGSHILRYLLPKNKIIGVNIMLDKKVQNYLPFKKDILKLSSSDVSGKLNAIIHLAAITDVNFCNKNPQKSFETNVLGTQNILEIARKKNCKFVFLSTNHVYGKPQKLPINENHPKKPNSIYAASKLAGEICCEGYAKSYGMDVSILRLFSVYGPNAPSHLVTSRIISQLGKKSIKLGNLNSKRDFVYIDDVIRAILTVLNKSKKFQVYNVGSGKSYSIMEICNLFKKISGRDIPVESVKSILRKSEINEVVADNSKIKKLGWKPLINISKGIQMYYQWQKSKL